MNEQPIKQMKITQYSKTEAALADLRKRYTNVIFDVSTAQGDKEARLARAEIKGYRVSLEKLRVQLKAPLLERGKLLDEEAKRITAELEKLEHPIDAQIKAEEKRKDAEKAAQAAAEKARLDALRVKIDEIRNLSIAMIGQPISVLAEQLNMIESLEITCDEYQELAGIALAAKKQAIENLKTMQQAMQEHEAEQARLQVEREELARLRREQEAQAEEARKARAEEEARLRAEREQQEAEWQTKHEALQQQQAALIAQQNAQPKEIEYRQPTEETSTTDSPDEHRAPRMFCVPPLQPSRPTNEDILRVLSLHYQVHKSKIIDWLLEMDLKAVGSPIAANL